MSNITLEEVFTPKPIMLAKGEAHSELSPENNVLLMIDQQIRITEAARAMNSYKEAQS